MMRKRPRAATQVVARLYAYIIVDAHGAEGLPITVDTDGALLPLVGADRARMDALAPHAQAFANASGRAVTLYCYASRVALQTLRPQEDPHG